MLISKTCIRRILPNFFQSRYYLKVVSHGKNLKMCTTLFRDCEREGAAKTVCRACLQGGKVTETPAKRVVS